MAESATQLAILGDRRPVLLRPIARPAEMIEAHTELVAFINDVLEDGRDFGVIPGTSDRKNLLKPGAERLNIGFGLRAEFDVLEKEIDHDREVTFALAKWVKRDEPSRDRKDELKARGVGRNKKLGGSWQWQEKEEERGVSLGLYRFVIRARLITVDGHEVGQGVGSCSSLETKYIRAPRDSENTILKMAKKRAYIDATLTTLGISDRFTQDVEDIVGNKSAASEPAYEAAIDAEYTEEPEVANYLTLDRTCTEQEHTLATDYMRACGVTKPQFEDLKAACGSLDWRFVLLEARKRSIAEPVGIIRLVDAGYGQDPAPESESIEPTPAEATQAPEPPEPPAAPTDDKPSSFGFTPSRWPISEMYDVPPSTTQGNRLTVTLKKRGFRLDDRERVVRTIWLGFGLPSNYTTTAAAIVLTADYLTEAPDASVEQVRAALEADRA